MKFFSTLFGLTFGILFAGAGFMVALETAVPTYQSWRDMQHWQPTTATLLRVSASYNNTEASYRYQVDDIAYQNDRVYVAAFKDNIGSYHQDLQQKLRWIKDNGQTVTIWYDPGDHSKSVIDRDMRWGLFAFMSGFCSIFILVGLIVCYASLRPDKAPRARKPSLTELRRLWRRQQHETHDNESFLDFARQPTKSRPPPLERSDAYMPWLDKKEWRHNRLRSGAKTKLYLMWGLAIVVGAASSPIFLALEDELRQQNYAVLLALVFPLLSLIAFFIAWKMTRAWLHFGVIELELDPFPGSIGGHVGGSLLIKNIREHRMPYQVELACVHSYVTGSGDDRSRHETLIWSEQGFASAEATGRDLRLEFRFDVPDNLPEADIEQSDDYYYWRLRLSGESEGVELKRDYNIPVFKTQTQSRHIRHDNSAQAAELRQQETLNTQAAIRRGDFEQTALARALRYTRSGRRHVFYYPMFRNKVLTLFALVFAAGFDVAAYQIVLHFGDGGIMDIVMLIFSLPFAIVGLFSTVAAVYLPFNNLSVTLTNGQIGALRRLWFVPIYHHSLPARDIEAIEIKSTGSTGATRDAQAIKHYKLLVVSKNQKRFTIAEDIDGEDLAVQLKAFIAERLGIST